MTISQHKYHCIRCLKQAPSLYRKFSKTSLKLSVCDECGFDVDPYVEREIFLVAMDLVLLRQDAYRHLLLNRIEGFEVHRNIRKAIQYVIASGILQTYLLWEAYRGNNIEPSASNMTSDTTETLRDLLDRQDQGTISLLSNLFPQALARIVTMGIVSYFSLRLFSRRATSPFVLLTRVHLAVVLPTSFAVVTILVLVWENTYTVRLLGSLLIFTYQLLSIFAIASVEGLSPLETTLTIGFAVALCALNSWALSRMGGLTGVPCAGFSHHMDGQLLSLCLT